MVNGPCAGGGYELALATDWIVMADDGNTAVSLPEVPLLAVLPGTGGLTRLVDKRHVRRDRADFFSTTEEGVKGKRAVEWGLVDEVVPRTKLEETARQRAAERASKSDRPRDAKGIVADAARAHDRWGHASRYPFVSCRIDRARGLAEITVRGPGERAACRRGRHSRAGRARSGRSRSRARSTTSSSTCAPTRKRSASGC